MTRHAILAAVLMFAAAAASAQEPFPARVLVPIADNIAGFTPGAFGSLWTVELTGRNESDSRVEVGLLAGCVIPEGCGTSRPAHTTFLSPAPSVQNPNGGVFMNVALQDAVSFTLRVQDVSRQAETWGTFLPIVYRNDTYTGTLQLLDVTVDLRFRSALRIYDFLATYDDTPALVRVRIFDMCGIGPLESGCTSAPLVDEVVSLSRMERENPNVPKSAMISDLLAAFPQLGSVKPTIFGAGRLRPAAVRIVVDPITEDLRYWAFASVTNNETQHVTAILPR